MKETKHVLGVLENTKKAVTEENPIKLKELSNQTIHAASVEQDPDSITVAVIVYSLSKIIERKKFQTYSGWPKFYKLIMMALDGSIAALKRGDHRLFKEKLKSIRREISKLSGKLKMYIQDVFEKAKINKASRIYEHGISMETTASLLGITMFDLAGYSGQTGISDVSVSRTLDVRQRIKTAVQFFK